MESYWKKNVDLLNEPRKFAAIVAIRLAALLGVILCFKAAYHWDGSLTLDPITLISLAIALFSVLLSCLFYLGADASARSSQQSLESFLVDMRSEHRAENQNIMNQLGGRRGGLVEASGIGEALVDPGNDETFFNAIAGLLTDADRQLLILMNQDGLSLPLAGLPIHDTASFQYNSLEYAFVRSDGLFGGFGTGPVNMSNLAQRMKATGFFDADVEGQIALTTRGREFARWLVENSYKATYVKFRDHGWGERPVDAPGNPLGSPFGPSPNVRNEPKDKATSSPNDGESSGDAATQEEADAEDERDLD